MVRATAWEVIAASVLMVGCSGNQRSVVQQQKPTLVSAETQVTVSANGKPIADAQQRLVHRVSVQEGELRSVFEGGDAGVTSLIDARSERDQFGKIAGVRINRLRMRPGLQLNLGLTEGDRVTAIGKRPAREVTDLKFLYEDLLSRREATMTVERNGNPHKIFLFLAPTS